MPERVVGRLPGGAVALEDLGTVAKELLRQAGDQRVWVFKGEMGSGKTTLIKAICTELGVDNGMSSPTFSIVNEYQGSGDNPIYHFDFYRLEKESEAYDMGVEEYLESGSYCFIEWPEKISGLLPDNLFTVSLSMDTPSTRKIEYTSL